MDTKQLSLNTILSQLMDTHQLTDNKLATETGINALTIRRMRVNANTNVTLTTLLPIANYFQIPIDALLGRSGILNQHQRFCYNQLTTVPLLDWIDVLNWTQAEENQRHTYVKGSIEAYTFVNKGSFSLTVEVDAMALAFSRGTHLVFDPDYAYQSGDVILFHYPDSPYIQLKELIIDFDLRYIKSLNPDLPGVRQIEQDIAVLGTVVESHRIHRCKTQPF